MVAALTATMALLFTQLAFGATPAVTTNPSFSLDFSDSSKKSGTTWTDQVSGLSATESGTSYSTEMGGIESFTASNSYLDFGKPAIGSAGNPSSDMTAEVWFRINTFNANWNILMSRWFDNTSGTSAASDFHFSVYSDTNANTPQINIYTTGKSDLRGTTTIAANKWYYAAFSVDNSSTTKKLTLYLNGQAENSFTSSSSLRTANTNNNLWVGDGRGAVAPNGQIAKARIYNRALTANEVKSNFEAERIQFGYTTSISISASNGVFRNTQTLSTSSVNQGRVTFYANGKRIPGCLNVSQSGSGPYVATCTWKPTLHGFNNLKAYLEPTNIRLAPSTNGVSAFITKRVSAR